jgi:hypothetical protein
VNEERAVAIRRVRPKADGFLLRLSLAVVLVAAVPGIVLGHNWGGGQDVTKPGRLCKTDAETGYRYSECTAGDSNHHVYISPVSGVPYTLYQALGDSIDQDYDSLAEVTAVQDLSYNTYQTDAVIYGANINSNWEIAFSYCHAGGQTALDNVRYHMSCRPQYIIYQNNPDANACWNDPLCAAHYACHELGHTLGLQHPDALYTPDSCMGYNHQDPTNLRPHDQLHLINCYPHPSPPLPTFPAETRTASCENP